MDITEQYRNRLKRLTTSELFNLMAQLNLQEDIMNLWLDELNMRKSNQPHKLPNTGCDFINDLQYALHYKNSQKPTIK